MPLACHPSTMGGQVWCLNPGVWDQPEQHGEISSLQKNIKISQVWWCASVVLVTRGAEVGGLPEPGRLRLQWALIMPLHSSLGGRVRTCFKKQKPKKQNGLNYKEGKLVHIIRSPEIEQIQHWLIQCLYNSVRTMASCYFSAWPSQICWLGPQASYPHGFELAVLVLGSYSHIK